MSIVRLMLALCIAALTANSFAHLSETVARPISIYIYNPKTDKTNIVPVTMFTSTLTNFHIENANKEQVCEGQMYTKGRDWIFKDMSCFNGAFTLPEVIFVDKFRFGVIKHGISMHTLADGSKVGIILHIGTESSILSEARVSEEKIKDLYGEFPNWKLPQ